MHVAEDTALARAAQLRQRGVAENNAGRPLRAVRLFRQALRLLTEDSPHVQALRARVIISLAMSESELGGLDRGMASLDEVFDYLQRHRDPAIEVHLHCQIGYMQVRGGLFDEGLASLNRAETMLDHVRPVEAANILLNRGMVYVFRRDLERARQDYARCIELSTRHGLDVELAKARHNMGELEFFAGNLATALRLMDSSAALGADVSRGVVLMDRSRVLIEAGLHREADESLTEAARLFRADRLFKDVGEAELARAECALLDGEIAAARRLAGSARTRFRRRGNDRWRRDAELLLLQADLAAGRPGSRLAPPALRLAEEFRSDGLLSRVRTARLIAAEALLRDGQLARAQDVASQAGPVRPDDPVSARLQTRLVRAKLLVATQDRRSAKREIRTGLAELARHQARFGSLDLQTASAVHGRQLAEMDVSLALDDADPMATLAAIERGRAVASRLPSVEAPQDEMAAELLAELRQTAEEIRVIESDPSAGRRLARQRHRLVEIQQLLRSRSWQAEGSGEATKPAAVRAVVDALSRQASALVSFVQAQDGLHAVVLDGARARTVPLGGAGAADEIVRRLRADLDVLAAGTLPASLAVAVRRSLTRSLGVLDDLLIEPLKVSDRQLVLSPTGVLATVPWNLLPSLRGRAVVVVPSATAWLSASVGDVSASNGSAGRAAVSSFAGPALEYAAAEARSVGRIWAGSAVFTGDRARQVELRDALTSATIVHIAAHGQHQPENPLFSSLRLADGPVFAYELDRAERAAEHVVLSACELGQATIRPGDEALGLTSVLLHLGTRSVVSGVARVHDGVAAEVMKRYHRALARGDDAARALASACEHTGDEVAPFVCFGSAWSVRPTDG